MSLIRAATIDDVPAIASMRMRSFRHTHHSTLESLGAYLREIFFENPWGREVLPSILYQDADGRPIGFLGLMPRPMLFAGRRILGASISTFVVDPDCRGRGIGRELMARCFAGPQDLTWGDVANDATRAIWQSLGGRTAWLYNLYWTRALRPLRSASATWLERRPGFVASLAVRPFAALVDPVVARMPGVPQRIPAPAGLLQALGDRTIAEHADGLLADYALHPGYSEAALQWLMRHVTALPLGALNRILVRHPDGSLAGWFIYFVNPRGTAQVVQLVASEHARALVLEQLVRHAWAAGVVTLAGRLDPHLLPFMSTRGFCLARSDPWVVVHSRHADVIDAFQNGDAFMSRLEGEWWMQA